MEDRGRQRVVCGGDRGLFDAALVMLSFNQSSYVMIQAILESKLNYYLIG